MGVLNAINDWRPVVFMVSVVVILFFTNKRIGVLEEHLKLTVKSINTKIKKYAVVQKGKVPMIGSESGKLLAYVDFEKMEVTDVENSDINDDIEVAMSLLKKVFAEKISSLLLDTRENLLDEIDKNVALSHSLTEDEQAEFFEWAYNFTESIAGAAVRTCLEV